jgi:POT family proton-dependent oligopeptide transporter
VSEAASQSADAGTATSSLMRRSPGFWVVNAVNLGDNISYFLILSLLVPYLSEQGLSDRGAGYAISFYTGAVTLAMLWGGKVSDRLGVRRSIGISMVLSTLGRGMLAACPWIGVPATLVGLLIAAVGAAICQPALYSGVKEMCHPRATALGYSVLYSTLSLGIGLGSFFSPFVRTDSDFGWGVRGLGLGLNGVMWTAAAVSAVTMLLHLVLFRPSMDPVLQRGAEEGGPRGVPWDPRFFYFICILIPVRTLFAHQFMTASTYVLRVFPTSISDRFEWFMGLNPPIVLVLVPLFTLTTRQVKLVDVMIVGTAVTALSTFMLVGPPTRMSLVGYIVLFSIGEAMWGSRFLEHVAELAPPGQLGLYMGVAGLPWFFAKFTTGLYSGAMLNHFVPAAGPRDPATLWLIYGGFAALSPLGLVLARRWLLAKSS